MRAVIKPRSHEGHEEHMEFERRFVIAMVVVSTFSILECGCAAKKESKVADKSNRYVEGEFTWYPGDRISRTVVLRGADLQRLLGFFPGVGSGASSGFGGGWRAAVVINLIDSAGTRHSLVVDRELRRWAEGKGEWPLNPGFSDFAKEIQSRSDYKERQIPNDKGSGYATP